MTKVNKPVKVKEVMPLVLNSTVSNNINLGLSQNDLLQLVIQDKLEEVEAEQARIKSLLKHLGDEVDILDVNFKEDLIVRYKETAEYKQMLKSIEAFKAIMKVKEDIREDFRLQDGHNSLYKEIKFQKGDLPHAENQRNPKEYYKSHTGTDTYYLYTEFGFTANIYCTVKDFGLKLEHYHTLNQIDKVCKAYTAKRITLYTQIAELQNWLYKVNITYLELAYGSDRIKSKITKAVLNNSVEGKEILGMLTKATGLKMFPEPKK